VERVVFASSSSVYGATDARPSQEDDWADPRSAYARSKWLAEQCCAASPVPVVTVRYFTVYGPRQRQDMAFARFIGAVRGGPVAPLYGDALRTTRDFTYVDDAVDGTLRAWRCGRPGRAYNISGGVGISLADARAEIERLAGAPVPCVALPGNAAEAPHTRADLTRARRELGYRPRTALGAGLQAQLEATMRNEQPEQVKAKAVV
jgi:nucleoside-diphosphate-sugar epimerase